MQWHRKVLTVLLVNLANLLKVKTIVTLSIVFTFCYMAVAREISHTDFMVVATAVFTYYFTKDNGKER